MSQTPLTHRFALIVYRHCVLRENEQPVFTYRNFVCKHCFDRIVCFFFNGKQIDKIQNAIFRVSCIFRPLFHLFREYKGPQMNSNGGQQTEKHEKCPSVFGVCVQFGCFRGCETPVFFFLKKRFVFGATKNICFAENFLKTFSEVIFFSSLA